MIRRMHSPSTRSLVVVWVAVTTLGCGGTTTIGPTPPRADVALTPVVNTAEWPASTPDAERLDPSRLTDLLNRIRRGDFGNIHSLLVARNERLVMEEYFQGWSGTASHTQQSVTKSVTSLAAGLAVDRGLLQLSDPVASVFPDYQPIAAMDGLKAALTVRDLLTMRGGWDWSEQSYAGSPLERMNTCACDWIRHMLDWRLREPPGARFEYVSGGVILLGAVTGRVTGSRVDRWLEAQLFSPLGFQDVRWIHGQPDGLPHTGGGSICARATC